MFTDLGCIQAGLGLCVRLNSCSGISYHTAGSSGMRYPGIERTGGRYTEVPCPQKQKAVGTGNSPAVLSGLSPPQPGFQGDPEALG